MADGDCAPHKVDTQEQMPLKNQVPASELYPGCKDMVIQEIDGELFLPLYKTKDYNEYLPILRELQLRSDDILIASYPRSGSHWLFEVVSMILRGETTFTDESSSILEHLGPDTQEIIDSWQSPRQLFCHIKMKRIPADVVKKQIKIIFTIRNPKDVLNSFYKLVKGIFTGTWEDFLTAHMADRYPGGGWFSYALDAERFMKDHPECPIYIHSYEKMKENPVESIRNLCRFLGRPDDLAEDIAKAVEFKSMIEQTKEKFERISRTYFGVKDQGFIRKGQVGDWKNQFTVAQSEAFNDMFEKEMAKSELAKYVRDYII